MSWQVQHAAHAIRRWATAAFSGLNACRTGGACRKGRPDLQPALEVHEDENALRIERMDGSACGVCSVPAAGGKPPVRQLRGHGGYHVLLPHSPHTARCACCTPRNAVSAVCGDTATCEVGCLSLHHPKTVSDYAYRTAVCMHVLVGVQPRNPGL